MRTAVALTFLVGPVAFFFGWRIHEYGFSFVRGIRPGFFPALASLLLAGAIAVVLSPEFGAILNDDFFPVRAYLPVFLSGLAFAVAIFPDTVTASDSLRQSEQRPYMGHLIALLSWLWVLLIIALVLIQYAG